MLKKSVAFLAALTASVSADGDSSSNVGANVAPAPATPVISYARIDLQQVAVEQNEEGELMENAIITGKERTTPATCAYATPTLHTQNAPKVAYASGMFVPFQFVDGCVQYVASGVTRESRVQADD